MFCQANIYYTSQFNLFIISGTCNYYKHGYDDSNKIEVEPMHKYRNVNHTDLSHAIVNKVKEAKNFFKFVYTRAVVLKSSVDNHSY